MTFGPSRRFALPLRFAALEGGGAGRASPSLAREVRRSVDRLYRLALRFTGDGAVAERVVIRTVERALNGASAVRSEPDTSVWLAGLLRDVCLSEHAGATASKARGRAQQPDGNPYTPEYDLGALAARLGDQVPEQVLMQLIDAMPFDLREVLVLRDLEGFEPDAVSRITGLPPGTVAVRLRAARLGLERRIIRYLQADAA